MPEEGGAAEREEEEEEEAEAAAPHALPPAPVRWPHAGQKARCAQAGVEERDTGRGRLRTTPTVETFRVCKLAMWVDRLTHASRQFLYTGRFF